ncbi:MAG: hypothetical protein JSR49_07990, partial [Proteobacteria bacterium]|nr:hypothetical protein [Pseudomonadota bacterium]
MNLQSVTGNKWVRGVAWAVAALLILWGVTWLAVPPLVKSEVQKIAGKELGRKVTVGAVDFKPWSLELTLTDLAVATADGAGQQFHLKRLYLNADIQSLFRFAPVLDAVSLDAPSLKLARIAEGHYDIDDILARLNQPAPGKPSGKPLRFAVYNVTLQGGSVDFDDKAVGKA